MKPITGPMSEHPVLLARGVTPIITSGWEWLDDKRQERSHTEEEAQKRAWRITAITTAFASGVVLAIAALS